MTLLDTSDKIAIIDQHLKNLEYSKYNIEISLVEENAVTSPDSEAISALNERLTQVGLKISALNAEKASLS